LSVFWKKTGGGFFVKDPQPLIEVYLEIGTKPLQSVNEEKRGENGVKHHHGRGEGKARAAYGKKSREKIIRMRKMARGL